MSTTAATAAAPTARPVPVAPGHVHRLAQHFEPPDASSSTMYIPMPAPAPYLLTSPTRRASLAVPSSPHAPAASAARTRRASLATATLAPPAAAADDVDDARLAQLLRAMATSPFVAVHDAPDPAVLDRRFAYALRRDDRHVAPDQRMAKPRAWVVLAGGGSSLTGSSGVRECLDAVEDLVESLELKSAEENEIQGVRDPAPTGGENEGADEAVGGPVVVSGSPSSIKADSEETVVVPAAGGETGGEKINKEVVDKGEVVERAVSFEGLPALTLARRVRRTLANIVLGARKDTHVPWFQVSSRHIATVMTELDGAAWHGVRVRLTSAIAKGENVDHDVFTTMATRFNKTTKAVTDACTTAGITEGTRSALVQKFVRVCEHLLAMHNLAAVQAIATALATLPRSARYVLPATEAAVLAHIMHLTSPVGNFARMRHLAAHWARHGDTCVPLVVPYLRDMAVAHEIGPDGAKRMPLLDWRELATARPPEVEGHEGANEVVAGLIG
ncbi:hypothetical protein GGF31_004260 [Allomyces arbusculus]|nr:hypothetical protein GGF31_004260 [Allomyces arbusculus]